MKKLFICLANSRKYSGRCIAGVELRQNDRGQLLLVENDQHQPHWIRPISQTEFGELDASAVRHIRLGDLIEVDITEGGCLNNSYQLENAYFDTTTLKVLDKLTLTKERLKRLSVPTTKTLFGNRNDSLPMSTMNGLYPSLTFVKVETPSVHIRDGYSGKRPQERLQFKYNGNHYDLALTDIEFIEKYLSDNDILQKANEVYITISLSIPFNHRLYKLAAGVFMI